LTNIQIRIAIDELHLLPEGQEGIGAHVDFELDEVVDFVFLEVVVGSHTVHYDGSVICNLFELSRDLNFLKIYSAVLRLA
jgi:hypothetical protein